MQHNNMLNKLANLESVFIGDQDDEIAEDDRQRQEDYFNSVLFTENKELRERLTQLEYEKVEMRHQIIALEESHLPNSKINAGDMKNPQAKKMLQLNEANSELEKRIEMLQKREQKLIESLMNFRKGPFIPQYSSLSQQDIPPVGQPQEGDEELDRQIETPKPTIADSVKQSAFSRFKKPS